jgi:hypothetical protein
MIDYTQRQTQDLNRPFLYPSKPPSPDDFQGWADGIRYYAEQLMKANPAWKSMTRTLIHDSQEIVYLFRFAQEHLAPFSDENPPLLWLKRYNDVAANLQMEFHTLDTEALAGCTTTTGGAAQPDHPAPTSATTTGTTPAPVPVARIADNLLKPSELAGIVGDTDMDEPQSLSRPDIQTDGVDPPDCAALEKLGNTFSYYAPGRTAAAGNSNVGARGHRASQLITVWQNREQAKKVVDQSFYEWSNYCRQPFTVTSGSGEPQTLWVRNEAAPDNSDSPTRIRVSYERQEPTAQTCGHAMASKANVVVETIACGDGDTVTQVKEIVNQILLKFPQ